MIKKSLPPLILLLPLLAILSDNARSQIVYNNDIQPIFTSNCIACHGGTSGVTLSTYQTAMASIGEQYGTNVIIPNQPDQSPIVNKISPNPTHGDRMPQGGPFLSDAQINLIRQWIAEGALESPATNLAIEDGLPARFELLGNYPNPFNPVTNVRFNLPGPASWSIKVYTTSGRFVAEEAGWSQGGIITVPLTLESQSSGMYLYIVEMITGGPTRQRLTGSMMLVK